MIEIDSVSMSFPEPRRFRDLVLKPFYKRRKILALDNINLSIEPGDRVAFLGVNGAGKTTLLKLIGGLLYASNGKITVNGFDPLTHNMKARKHVGYVLNEERSFYWRLTGLQNLEFFGALDNISKEKLKETSSDLLELVGLESAGSKLVASYSSGMKQRLAIARGLLADPMILILDEPTRTLDPQAVEDVKRLISHKIHEKIKRTLLIATHRFDEAEELCNRVCVMKQGRIISIDSVDHIKSNFKSISNYYHTKMHQDYEL